MAARRQRYSSIVAASDEKQAQVTAEIQESELFRG
jgi:hypothetical protein